MGSADWMPRNFFRRIEVVFPIEDGVLRERIISEILEIALADNSKARILEADGSYLRPIPQRGQKARRSQAEFIALAHGEGETRRKSGARKVAIRKSNWRPLLLLVGAEGEVDETVRPSPCDCRRTRNRSRAEGFGSDADARRHPKTEAGDRGMKQLGISFDLILSSPYLRALQTAKLTARGLGAKKKLKMTGALKPDSNFRELIKELQSTGVRAW